MNFTKMRCPKDTPKAELNVCQNVRFLILRKIRFWIISVRLHERGRKLLKNSPGKNLIVTKTADFNGSKNSMFKYDILATDFAYLCANDKTKRMSGADFYTPPVYIKN